MTFLSRFFAKDPLDALTLGELKKSLAQLTRQIKKMEEELKAAESAIRSFFIEAADDLSPDRREQSMLRIQSATNAWQLKHRSILQAERDLSVISNIIAIKEHERVMGSSRALSTIKDLDPGDLESWLARKTLLADGSSVQVQEISEITSGHMAGADDEPVDGDTIMDLLVQVQGDGLAPDSACKALLTRIIDR